MWVKSQDGGLYNVQSFEISVNHIILDSEEISTNGYNIIGFVGYAVQPQLGYYKTKERALEVIDAIYKFINHDTRQVFVMPEV